MSKLQAQAASHGSELESLRLALTAEHAVTLKQLETERASTADLRAQCAAQEVEMKGFRDTLTAARERLDVLQAEHATVAADRDRLAHQLAIKGSDDSPSNPLAMSSTPAVRGDGNDRVGGSRGAVASAAVHRESVVRFSPSAGKSDHCC
jgi:peptidoglycan hydrolase CwlO-like protein